MALLLIPFFFQFQRQTISDDSDFEVRVHIAEALLSFFHCKVLKELNLPSLLLVVLTMYQSSLTRLPCQWLKVQCIECVKVRFNSTLFDLVLFVTMIVTDLLLLNAW